MIATILKHCNYWISPPVCMACRIYLDDYVPFCTTCLTHMPLVLPELHSLPHTKKMWIYAATEYKTFLKPLVNAKFYSRLHGARFLAALLGQRIPLEKISCDVLVPIPLHSQRLRKRGFNQAQIMAEEIAKRTGWRVDPLLARTKLTSLQAGLTPLQRVHNLEDAFTVRSSVTGKHIVLIDDLMTTGATLYSAAAVLVNDKPLSISALVGCRI